MKKIFGGGCCVVDVVVDKYLFVVARSYDR